MRMTGFCTGLVPTLGHFYYLSVQDLARFGVRNVTLREPMPKEPRDADGARKIHVDWPDLETARPMVRLD
jgi:hypothetical protein